MAYHVIISGNISKTLMDYDGKWDNFNRCRLTGVMNGKMTRIIPAHSCSHMLRGLMVSGYEWSHHIPTIEQIEIARSRIVIS